MKHQAIETLQIVDKVDLDYPHCELSKTERLERWAALLESGPKRKLRTLNQTEFQSAETRDAMRVEGSALTVAFDDPYLRAAGLSGDTYGETKRFFELSDHQLHHMICYCHLGANVSAGTTAMYVRRLLPRERKGMLGWLRRRLAV